MDIEKIPNQVWIDTIKGKIKLDYECLALKILLGRLRVDVNDNSSVEVIQKYTEELKNFFLRTQKLPSSQKDLQKIIKENN